MKRGILLSLLSFVLGLALAGVILVNPMGWAWADSLHHSVISLAGNDEASSEATEGQLWTCGMHPQVVEDHPGTCPICGMDLIPLKGSTAGQSKTTAAAKTQTNGERKILYWRAPMDPTYTSDKPGKSPMGMDLVPVYADEAAKEEEQAADVVKIDPTFVQNIGVQTAPVKRTDIPFTIRTIGNVTYSDEQLHWVNTKYDGWIEKAYVNYVGQPVRKGQKLFEIYSPQLVTTQKEYLDALDYAERLSTGPYPDIKERARSLLEASRQRLAYWDITDAQVAELEKTRKPRRTLTVVSPVSGMVVQKMDQALEGMYAKAGMNLYKIVDLSTIWVEADIFENQIPWLKTGQTALVEFPYQPGRKYRGRIRYVYPFFNDKTRTMKVSISLPNPGLELKKDMYANVTFDVPSAHNVLTVPEEAVIRSGERNIVVLSLGNGEFQIREVTLGLNGNGLYEVKKGLKEGEQIVVSSQFLIDSESNLKEAIRKMVSSRS
ncbi:MAG: efflux RND transporter periplasmic adaptor subunit [Acidobacteriota bacterium]